MERDLKEILNALGTTSMVEAAEILGIAVPPDLTLLRLVDEFLLRARPDDPKSLDIAPGGSGTHLSWTDPGAGTFRAATLFHWNFWRVTDGRVFLDGSENEVRHSFTIPTLTGPDQIYELNVQAFNLYEGEQLQSGVSQETLSTASEGCGTGVEGGGGTGYYGYYDYGGYAE